MANELSVYVKYLLKRFKGHVDDADWEDFIGLALIPEEIGIEDKMLEFLKDNPDATWRETDAYMGTFLKPLEIVDDDEVDEDE